jgi:hypothetical protein
VRHVDDGLLHAYLDGALDALADAGALPAGVAPADVAQHLRTCPHCRALLERERALRDEASALLRDAAAAAVDVPPFESIPGAQPAADGGPLRRALPFAWAASLAVALGAGWWGSAVWRDPGPLTPDAAVVSPAPPSVAVSAPASPDAPLTAVADDVAAPGAPLDSPRRGGSDMPAADLPAVVAAPEGRATSVGDWDAQHGAVEAGRQPAARVMAEVSPRLATAPEDARLVAGVLADTGVADLLARGPAAPGPLALTSGPVTRVSSGGDTRPSVLPPGGGRPVQRGQAAAAPRTKLPVVAFREAVASARAGELSWQPVPPTRTPLVFIDGAERLELLTALLADGTELVRLRQRLADGTVLELFQWQDPEEPGAVTQLADGRDVPTVVANAGAGPGGGQEALLRAPALGMYLLLAASMEARQLLNLAESLTVEGR